MIEALRLALRRVTQTRLLSGAAVVCIGLGAAATTTVATLVSATLIRPVPFAGADRLVRVWFDEPGINPRVSMSIPDLADFAGVQSFDAFLGTARVRTTLRSRDGAERVRGEAVTSGYFDTLGIRPHLGRLLTPADHATDAARVVVLSHGAWVRLFGAEPAAIGREFRTERAAYTVVGITPPGFAGTVEDDIVEFFIPLEHYEPASLVALRTSRPAWVVARLKRGATIASATAQAAAVHRRLVDEHPDIYRRWHVRVEPFGENWRQTLRTGGTLMFAASTLLLMIAAINVGCLLLARALMRWRELAVRAALGASRARLAGESLVEAAVLVVAGGGAGLLTGPWLLQLFMSIAPPGHLTLPAYVQLEPDAATLAITLSVLGIAALVAGTVPALLARSVTPGDVLRSSGRTTLGGGVERRWGSWLVASEMALTLVLLAAGALLLRSHSRLASADVGFDRQRIARLAVTLSPADVGEPSRLPAAYARLEQEIGTLPGVHRVGLVSPTLPPYDGDRSRFRPGGLDLPHASDGLEAGLHLASERLLPMLGARILAGRNLRDEQDAAVGNVAVVSGTVADLFGGADLAIGRIIELEGQGPGTPSGAFHIVGVAENVAWDGLADETRTVLGASSDLRGSRYDVYLPLSRYRPSVVSIGVWTPGDSSAVIPVVRQRLAQLFPASAVHWVGSMEDDIAFEYAPARFYAVLVAAFSWSALALAALGLFALLSHAAARRGPEMALRMALGASPRSTAMLLLRAGLMPVWTGAAAGLVLATLAARAMGSLLYRIDGYDGSTILLALAMLTAVALAAAWPPARTAAAADPATMLKSD